MILLTMVYLFVQDESALANHKKGLMLKGYDPISYHTGKPIKGEKQWSVLHRGMTFRFANPQNRAKFLEDPAHYMPLFGGWCAYAMLDGERVDIDPKSFKIVDGKLLLFYDGVWGDTQDKWNQLASKSSDRDLVMKAQDEWRKQKP